MAGVDRLRRRPRSHRPGRGPPVGPQRDRLLSSFRTRDAWRRSLLGLLAGLSLAGLAPTGVQAASGDWPRYLHDNTGSGFGPGAGITAANAPRLKLAPGWPVRLGGPITTQPVVANGLIYVGAWDGYEYALNRDGSVQWKTYLGRTENCFLSASVGRVAGVASTGAVVTEPINGSARSVMYVGGGGTLDPTGGAVPHPQARIYALDALTGSILWETALGRAPSHFSWTSPAVFQDSVYMGVSSFNDCPLIQGQLVKLDARTGAIQHTFDVVPTGCEGGSVWGSPVVDEPRGDIYFATGNARICSVLGPSWGRFPHTKRGALAFLLGLAGVGLALLSWRLAFGRLLLLVGVAVGAIGITAGALLLVGPTFSVNRPYAISLVKVAANDLHVEGVWHVPHSDDTDHDFGTTPTLFRGTVTPGGRMRDLVGAVNKDGFYYVFDRTTLGAGPLARIRIANGHDPDPTRGSGSISPSAYDGRTVYVAGGLTRIGETSSSGSVVALNPNDLERPIWQQPLSGPVLGAVSAVPGLVVVGAGSSTVALTAADGTRAFTAPVASTAKPAPAVIYAAATIANGIIYQGDTYGYLYAYSVDGR